MLRHWFIVPDLSGPVSGGTLYNRRLTAALGSLGVPCVTCDFEAGAQALSAGREGLFWIDTLYLSGFADLAAQNRAGRRLGLLCHYLPSLVRGEVTELDAHERLAIDRSALFLAPSAYMKAALERFGAPGRAVLVAEPGRPGPIPLAAPGGLRALIVANLVPGKGIEPFLARLSGLASSLDRFELRIVGSLESDPAYARACRALVAEDARIVFDGAATPDEVLRRMSEASLIVSASRMESYGMALAEARALGVPILARAGGNVASLVEMASGGELVADEAALARAFVRLCREPDELSARAERARRSALPARTWAEAAEDFLAQLRAYDQ